MTSQTISNDSCFPIGLAEALHKKYPQLPDAKDLINDKDFIPFFEKGNKKLSIEERRGLYDPIRCDARVWYEQKGSRGLGFDDIQCRNKKIMNDCFCRKHSKMFSEGLLWTGKITEDRPEPPIKPDGTLMKWSTDSNGNDIVKSNDPLIKDESTKSVNDMSIEELLVILKKKGWTDGEGEETKEGAEGGIGAGVGFEDD